MLPAYTSIGCYPIFYVDMEGNCLCAVCADEEQKETIEPLRAEVNWESDLYCDECSCEIEKAYE